LLDHITTAADVSARALVRVLPQWSGPPAELRALYSSRTGLPPKVRVFLEFLAQRAKQVRMKAAESPRPTPRF
jgi:DNA-binding transcriptional LysR family regulator